MPFLPINAAEVRQRGWEQVDFVYVTGDAYVDHPSFGVAIISRVLEDAGYRVAILPQPDVSRNEDFTQFGTPRLGFLVTAGNIDSMVAHYTAAKKPRSDDPYSPGNKAGKRPDRALTVYCRKLRQLYGDTVPVIAGGLEASLRRFAHYDYWADRVLPSVLADSQADLLLYGMGEKQIVMLAERLAAGIPAAAIRDLPGCCFLTTPSEPFENSVACPGYDKVASDKEAYARATRMQLEEQDHVRGRVLTQRHGDRLLVQMPPMPPLSTAELDRVYALPYMRTWHPSYDAVGGIKAIEEVRFSLTHNRGCFGACNFCSIAFHQGRSIACRSEESVLQEAKLLTELPDFKGYIHDVGGPTANFRQPSCAQQVKNGMCKAKKCLAPAPCKNLIVDHSRYLRLLQKLEALPKVKKVFVRSGLRFDYIMADPDDSFLRHLIQNNVSGQLKVAPEHCSSAVLEQMGKPNASVYEAFEKKFYRITKQIGKEQYLVPYLMSSHPGSTLKDAIELALFLKRRNLRPEQVQDFYPTPGTASTCMYYTGINPFTGKSVYVARDPQEKRLQRALLQYFDPKNRALVIQALTKAGRSDLIGRAPSCLVAPLPGQAPVQAVRKPNGVPPRKTPTRKKR
ncbi:MAG: YgiQ family radical SAM protein [Clostridia bacterium]|nr:YgiQ family radical SAM protein [Clostridia bacterium]